MEINMKSSPIYMLFFFLLSVMSQETPAAASLPGPGFVKAKPFALTKNNLVTELPFLGKEYQLTFELKVTKFGAVDTRSVIHLSATGADCCNVGDRVPAVWITKDKKFHIAATVNGIGNYYQDVPTVLEENKWILVEISQTLVDGKYIYEILVNEESVHKIENTTPQVWGPVKVFAADDWYPSVEGQIKNLMIETKNE
eukprot:TRINITY_DN1675_c0_g1_i25.p1 TRINITY_DN1675_c0_g1~~TRINITY_DN1675_c0_g1_i25.p1  ORF type:complete len:198 (-),score=31.25 TRINITY_DN1675_c0_g1_i25:58-651(-)